MDPKYLVIEGPIGVGKTSLVSLLAEELGGQLTLESAPSQGTPSSWRRHSAG